MATVTDTRFILGLLVGVALCYGFHHYAMPLPGPNRAARRGGG